MDPRIFDSDSTIKLTMYPRKRMIQPLLGNARYHHAKAVQAGLARPGCRVKLHSIPTYYMHLGLFEWLSRLMCRHHHPQQVPRNLQRLQRRDSDVPTPGGAQDLATLPR